MLMMLAWMGGLVLGVRGIWPLLQRPALTPDLVIPLVWLVIGTAAWIVALNVGLQRFRRR
jgi:tryptophan-rich sensory protein